MRAGSSRRKAGSWRVGVRPHAVPAAMHWTLRARGASRYPRSTAVTLTCRGAVAFFCLKPKERMSWQLRGSTDT